VTADPPVLDGRTRADLTERTRALATAYTDGEWTPGQGDPGDAVVSIFGELAGDLTERLDQRPRRHRVGFVDRLGFERQPPTAARVPIAVAVADGVDSVTVPEATAVLAPGTDGSERTFLTETGSAFEATSAAIDRVYAVDPETDTVVDHRDAVDGGASQTLFDGANQQTHALYLGDDSLLTVPQNGGLRVVVDGPTPGHLLESGLRWEYHGEDATGAVGWHSLAVDPAPVDPTATGDDTTTVSLTVPGTMTPTTVGGRESHFVRARVPAGLGPLGLFDVRVDSVAVGPGPLTRPPMLMLAGDVPQESGPMPTPEADPTTVVLPFGETPTPRDAFYVADEEVFSKAGADVGIVFYRPSESTVQPAGPTPRLSWEYWDGTRWASLSVQDGTDAFTTTGVVRFTVPADLSPTRVAGEDTRWIRVRFVGGEYVTVDYDLPTLGFGTHEVEVGPVGVRTGDVPAYSAVAIDYLGDPPADVPAHRLTENGLAVADAAPTLEGGGRLAPFVPVADTTQTVYLGLDCQMSGGPFTQLWDVTERVRPPTFEPSVRWEYATDESGTGWARAPVTDETEGVRRTGVVSLEVPGATTARSLFGVDRHWLRARVSGDRFETRVRRPAASALPVRVVAIDAHAERVVLRNEGDSPVDLTGFQVDFEFGQPADQRRTLPVDTHVGPGDLLVVETGAEPPGTPAADVRFTFTRPVVNTVDPDTVALCTPDGDPVHALTDAAPDQSVDLSALTRRVESVGPADARLSQVVDDATDSESGADESTADAAPAETPPCEPTLQTTPHTARPTRAAPAVAGLYRNVAWAADVRRITDERVGSSTGGPDQQFTLRATPVLNVTVRVDEAPALSDAAREALLADPDESVGVERGDDGEIRRVFVTWTRVPDLLSSGPEDRHYVLDALTGDLRFGDGTRGRKPPRSRDGLRADYETGGGRAGNVPAGAVTDLVSSLAFVDGVTNPIPADGGSEAESTAAVLDRAPRALRDRGRAVTPADVERVAATASRQLARIRCLPRVDDTGASRPGWVSLLLVPDTDDPRPTPSVTLRDAVTAGVGERLPASVVAGDRLSVRGPSYVTAAVTVAVVGDGSRTVGTLEATVTDELTAFLHPVTGGPDGEGWPFGRLPGPGDLFARLEDLDGVDHVADLVVRFDADGDSVTVAPGETPPAVADDVLVASGSHAVTATGGTR
jgi:predicted phage baseplate assembly protein